MAKLVNMLVFVTVTIGGDRWRTASGVDQVMFWSINVRDSHQTRMYYTRGDPDQYLPALFNEGQSLNNKYTYFNASIAMFGAVAADSYIKDVVFTHDLKSGHIYLHNVTSKSASKIFKGLSTEVKDLAVDWINKNLYYTDPMMGIGMYSYKNQHYTIISEKLQAYHGIDVDPTEGYLFYVDSPAGQIVRCSLAGTDPTPVVTSQARPTLLVVDVRSKMLFWVDVQGNALRVSNYDGSARSTLWNSFEIDEEAFAGIDVTNEYILLAMKNTASVAVLNKTTAHNVGHLSLRSFQYSVQHGLVMTGTNRQPSASSTCTSSQNGGCQHICTTGQDLASAVCLCQFGYQRDDDGTSCTWEPLLDNFLVLTDTEAKLLYQVDLSTADVRVLPSNAPDTAKPEAVGYDPVEKTVYWTDITLKQIRRINLVSKLEEVFFELSKSGATQAFYIDVAGRFIYYSDASGKRINRINISTKDHMTVLRLAYTDRPLKIQIDHESGYIYWTDWGFTPKIERANVTDGSGREVVVSGDLQLPSGMVLDTAAGHLYWSDARMLRLERCDLDGSNRRLISTIPEGTFDLTVNGEHLYIAHNTGILQIKKSDGSSASFGPRFFWNLFGIQSSRIDAATTDGSSGTNSQGPPSTTVAPPSTTVAPPSTTVAPPSTTTAPPSTTKSSPGTPKPTAVNVTVPTPGVSLTSQPPEDTEGSTERVVDSVQPPGDEGTNGSGMGQTTIIIIAVVVSGIIVLAVIIAVTVVVLAKQRSSKDTTGPPVAYAAQDQYLTTSDVTRPKWYIPDEYLTTGAQQRAPGLQRQPSSPGGGYLVPVNNQSGIYDEPGEQYEEIPDVLMGANPRQSPPTESQTPMYMDLHAAQNVPKTP